MKVDLSRFHRSVTAIAAVPGRRGAEVLNKSVEKIVIGSKGSRGLVHLTEKAAAAKINADLNQFHGRITLLRHLAIVSLKRKGAETVNGKAWKILVAAEMRRIRAARIRSRGATVAGWLHGLEKFRGQAGMSGGNGGAGVQLQPDGSASKTLAKAATAGNLMAFMINGVEGSGIVCPDATIQAAINSATADNLVYLRRKFGEGIDRAINIA
jgi:hypothetical protein